jgi:hypothetical protein
MFKLPQEREIGAMNLLLEAVAARTVGSLPQSEWAACERVPDHQLMFKANGRRSHARTPTSRSTMGRSRSDRWVAVVRRRTTAVDVVA